MFRSSRPQRWALVLFLAVLGVVPGRRAGAVPITTALTTIRSEATTVVIGTMKPDFSVDVDTVVRGVSPLGPRKLKSSPDGSSYASGRVLVLLDKNGAFRWVGTLAAGPSIETGVLNLSGFFDFNAHLVSPGTMTLAQLRDFFANGTLTQKLVATITVEDGGGSFVSSGRGFTVDYDALARKATVSGLAGACLGNADVRGLDWGTVTVSLSSNCPPPPGVTAVSQERSLELEGKPTGVDANGAITVDVSPSRPFLDSKDFPTFMTDTSIATAKRILDVKLSDGSKWKWDVGTGLVDAHGAAHPAGGLSSQSQSQNGVTTHTEIYDFQGAAIVFTPTVSGTMSTGGHAPTLVTMIDSNTYGTCTFKEPGHSDRSCTLGRGVTRFVKR